MVPRLSVKLVFTPVNYLKKTFYNKSYIILFLLLLLMGVAGSAQPIAGFYGILKMTELWLFGRIASGIVAVKNNFRFMLLVFAGSMLLQAAIAITQFLKQGSIGGIFYYLGERTFNSLTPGIANVALDHTLILRPYGTLPHPNVLGGYLLIGLILLLKNTPLFKNKQKIFLVLVIFVSMIAMFLSMSRTALLTGFIVLLFSIAKTFFLRQQFTINKNYLQLVFIFLTSLIIIYTYPPLAFRYFHTDWSGEAVVVRAKLIKTALMMFADHPLLGVGLNNFLVKLPEYNQLHDIPLQPVHNVYLLIAVETGVMGFLIFSWLLYRLFTRVQNSSALISDGIQEVFLALLLLGFNDHYLWTLQQGRLLLTFSIILIFARFNNVFGLRRG